MRNKTLSIVIAALALIGIVGWEISSHDSSAVPSVLRDTSEFSSKKLTVTASFYPLYFFASEIGGDEADVASITPAGAEPHEYEPTPSERARIERSNLLILNGIGLEPWGDDVRKTLGANTIVVTASDELASRSLEENGSMISDPHVWLDPPLAKKMANTILAGFVRADPTHADTYRHNAAMLEASLDDLDAAYRVGLSNCATKDIITSHAAFGYLAARYGLTQVSIAGLSPDEEPSPSDLARIAAFAKANEVSYIFFESLVSPKFSETVASEIGAKTLVLNPIEGLTDRESAAGENYFSIMQKNLVNLQTALQCM